MSYQASPSDFPVRDTLIVVLGMHRSGTSALTRAMHVLGAEFGSNLMPAAQGVNDKGFFEDVDINAFNVRLLHEIHVDWHTMAPPDLGQLSPERMAQLRQEALQLLRDKCAHCTTLVIKDPRVSRLLSFWMPLIDQLGRRVIYAIAIRNPISVVASLAKRDQFPEEKSYLLWLAHTVPALEATRHLPRAIISYDRLVDAPRAELERLSQSLGLPMIQERLVAFERDFLDTDLRHTRHTASDVQNLGNAPQQLKALYEALDQSFNRTSDHADTLSAALADARDYLDNIAPLLRYEWRLEQNGLTQQQHLAELAEQHTQIAQQHADVVREHRAILQSTSWRITSLLRAVRRKFAVS